MTIPHYFDEISNYIENNITQPDIILKILYDKHLKNKNTRTRTFTKNKPTIFCSLPSSTHKKGEIIESSLFSTLKEMLDLYDITSRELKKCIISILNAFVSYFPEEIDKLPVHIKSQLSIIKPSDILSHLVDKSLLPKMIANGQAEGLDPLLCELPDKGENAIQNVLREREKDPARHLSIRDFLKSLGQIPASVAALPLPLKNNILTTLLGNIINHEHANTLVALAHSLSTVPNFQERVSERLHTILRSERPFVGHDNVAYCLSQLVNKGLLHYSDESKKIIADYLNHLKNGIYSHDRYHLLSCLKELGNLVSVCDVSIAKELILALCHILNTDDQSCRNILLIALSNLTHVIITMPEEVIDTVVDSFIKQIPYLDWGNLSDIKKFQCVLELKPSYIEKMLSAISGEIMDTINHSHRGKMEELVELFVSWHSLLKDMKHVEIDFLKKLYQHYKENASSKWISLSNFSDLISCFEHLPEELFPLVNFFKEKLNDNDETTCTYAIYALGNLHFSLKFQFDSGLSVLTHMNEIFSKPVQDINDELHAHAILSSLGHMSDLLSIHQTLIKDVFMNLNRYILTQPFAQSKYEIINLINRLPKHLNEATPEDKRKILTFLEENIDEYTMFPTLCLLSKHMNKKTLLSKYLDRFVGMPEFTKFLMNTISDIPTHSQRLSFVCMLAKFKYHLPQSMALANTLGALFLHLRRQELLSEKLPKELVGCVEEYVEDKCIKAKCY